MNFYQLRETYFKRLSENRQALERCLLSDYLKRNSDDSDIDEKLRQHVDGRSQFFINSILPWIDQFKSLEGSNCVEIGPGTGATTAPMALACKNINAYDISECSVNAARERCSLLGIDNVNITCAPPDKILDQMRRENKKKRVDIVLLFAVLEHQKLEERLNTLRACWEILDENGILVVGDTPNRLVYRHGHTSRFHFFDMVPDVLMREFADEYPNTFFSDSWKEWQRNGLTSTEVEDRIDRWGRGVSFHEFSVALGSLDKLVIGDGFEKQISRAIPLGFEEYLLMQYLAEKMPDIPLGFSRSSLYLILGKNGENFHKKKWNEESTRQNLRKSTNAMKRIDAGLNRELPPKIARIARFFHQKKI